VIGGDVGEAREVMDRVAEAMVGGDLEALRALYAEEAVYESPGRVLRGPDEIVAYVDEVRAAFPDISWEGLHKHEAGNVAIDEGYFTGTNTGTMTRGDGGAIPATGKSVRCRDCDIATVENGVITSHRVYFDMLDLLTQLGLVPAPDA
jgi:ketosteroid isomerase-like protein